MIDGSFLSHLSKAAEQAPLLGPLAQFINSKGELTQKLVYGIIATAVGGAIIATPGVLWALYQQGQENKIRTIRINQHLSSMEGRIESLKTRQAVNIRLLQKTREQLMRRTREPR